MDNIANSKVKDLEIVGKYIEEPFSYEMKVFNNKTYYLITKDNKSLEKNDYYIIGYDEYLKEWYCDKIPERISKLEDKNIDNILDFTYFKNSKYERFNKDILFKECTLTEGEFDEKIITRTKIINDKKRVLECKVDCFNPYWNEIKWQMKNLTYPVTRTNFFRKNITITGEAYRSEVSAFKNCIIYSNGKEIFKSDKPVTFNNHGMNFSIDGYGEYTKLRSYLYYKYLDIDISFKTRYEKAKGYCLRDRDGEILKIYTDIQIIEKVKDKRKKKRNIFIGDCKVEGVLLKLDRNSIFSVDGNGNYIVSTIVCIGKFKVTDENGSERIYGDKDKVYILSTSNTYYCKDTNRE